jgi:hypothetical protein
MAVVIVAAWPIAACTAGVSTITEAACAAGAM